jgi:hypothetical protein
VLNGTVSDARLSLLARAHSPTRFLVACIQAGRPVPFALHGTTLRLYVEHEVDATNGKAHTASYRYVLQADETHESWLARWEYVRERPRGYPYALGHVHVRGEFAHASGTDLATKALERLHLPTARVAFELVLRHLIAEWRVQPKTERWEQILEESLECFEQRRTAR